MHFSAWLASLGLVPNAPIPPFPAGFNALASPLGVTAGASSEPRLPDLPSASVQAPIRRVTSPSVR